MRQEKGGSPFPVVPVLYSLHLMSIVGTMSNATRKTVVQDETKLPPSWAAAAEDPATVPAPPGPVGILSNPASGGNRKSWPAVARLIAGRPDIVHREIAGAQDIVSAVADFARREVQLIVVNGGDGTVQGVLTALYGAGPFAQPPPLALLRGGTASMLARDIGLPGAAPEALERLLHRPRQRPAAIVSRPIIEVRSPGREPLFGMFFGAGAICRGIELCHSRWNRRKWRGEWMPGMILARLLWDVLRQKGEIVRPANVETAFDGQPLQRGAYLLLLVSTLERLFLGLHPFWGAQDAPLHFSALGSRPRHLLSALPAALRGRRSRHLREIDGYCSRNVRDLRLRLEGGFTLDGELFAAEPSTALHLRAAGPARFLCL